MQSLKDFDTTTFTDTIFIYFFLSLVQSLKKILTGFKGIQ